MQTPARQRGVNLVELMITLVVASIVMTVGVPSFVSQIKDNRRVTIVNELVSALQLARSEASKSNATIGFCPSSNHINCNASNYDRGWIVFQNDDGDMPPVVDSGELILRANTDAESAGGTIRASGGIGAGFNFLASGRPQAFGDLTYCDDRGRRHARSVNLDLAGTIHAAGKHSNGSLLTCP